MKFASRRSQVAGGGLRPLVLHALAVILPAFFVTGIVNAQVVASTGRGVVVAHDSRIELFDRTGAAIWSAAGVPNASAIVAGGNRVAVLDAFGNQAALVDLANGRSQLVQTGETPVAGAFIDGSFFVLERDARMLERIDADGARSSVALAADPSFLREVNGSLYVYSRVSGLIQEISPARLSVTRTLQVAPFASDFETDGRTGYLVLPRRAKLATFSLATMRSTGEMPAGVVPADLAVSRKGNALSAPTLSVADPSAKRIWIAEGSQSATAAFARGFLRGLLGLGLFAPRNSDFPTGIDRLLVSGSTAVAYDSASRTLYRLRGTKGTLIARDVSPQAFAVSADGAIYLWQNGRLQLIR